uniref:Uncharacterized protein n=1 Tax=Kalanchoe fedtschenkoi TaxID=63787 RepID=A0A7N0U7W6_KALFE
MEGLIPLVYNKMKRNKIRRTYHCLSTSPTTAYGGDYNISDFYADPPQLPPPFPPTNKPTTFYTADDTPRHRRRNSMPDDFMTASKATDSSSPTPPIPGKQFVRFRSQRMFSCACVNVA